MEPRDAVQQQCALNVPWSMRAPALTPLMHELWRGTSIVIKRLQRMEKGTRNPKGENREKMVLPWCAEICTGDQLLVTAKQTVSCAVQTDVTWVKSDNPVRPKAPPPKGMQAGTQTSTPQQTPTKASQAMPGRSSVNKSQVEIVDGVAGQKKSAAPVKSASVSSWGKKSPVRVPPKEPDRLKKIEQDPVKVYNGFEHLLDGDLTDGEMEVDHVPSKS